MKCGLGYIVQHTDKQSNPYVKVSSPQMLSPKWAMSSAAQAGRHLRIRFFAMAPSRPLSEAQIKKLRRNKLEEIYKIFRTLACSQSWKPCA